MRSVLRVKGQWWPQLIPGGLRLASLASPHLASPHLASSHLTSPHLHSTKTPHLPPLATTCPNQFQIQIQTWTSRTRNSLTSLKQNGEPTQTNLFRYTHEAFPDPKIRRTDDTKSRFDKAQCPKKRAHIILNDLWTSIPEAFVLSTAAILPYKLGSLKSTTYLRNI